MQSNGKPTWDGLKSTVAFAGSKFIEVQTTFCLCINCDININIFHLHGPAIPLDIAYWTNNAHANVGRTE
jgi:hypothetical protein